MEYNVELKRSSSHQASNYMKEKAVSPQTNRSLRCPDKHKEEFFQQRIEQYPEFLRYADGKQMAQTKISGDQIPSQIDTKKDDELVKHMSNLPGYLQQTERGENVQEKALNFGVLDWKRLERWKYDEKLIPARGSKKLSSSNNALPEAGGTSIISSTAKRKTNTSQTKQLSSHGWRHNSAYEEELGVRSQRNVTEPRGHETIPRSTIDMIQNLRPREKFSGMKCCEISLGGEKWKESDCKAKSEKVTQSSSSGIHEFPVSLTDKGIETNSPEEGFDLATQVAINENIVLILPKSLSRNNFSEDMQLSEPRKVYDGNLAEAVERRFSSSFSSDELHSVETYSEISHSCPFPASGSTKFDSDTEQKNFVKPHGDESHTHRRLTNITIPTSDIEPLTTETPKNSGQDLSGGPAAKGRHPSPRRRFSFSSIGRMTKSFSLKEGLGVPQLNSSYSTVKSGPLGSLAFADFDKYNQGNASTVNRSRSSPLRRLLDPLLKPKEIHSTEFVKPSKIDLEPVNSNPLDTSELRQSQTCETSCVQALLQLTLKNGLPLYKLVVDNSSDIFAAAVKKLPTPEEDVPSLIYALYSVHEIKKKSGNWMSQGSKGKSSSLGYNVIGEIKVASSHLPGFSCQNTNYKNTVRESVLYGVDIEHEETETPKFVPSRELAALVIDNPNNTSDGGESDKRNEYFKNFDGKVREDSTNTTVIFPGGIHGLPNRGAPSPLLNRWRSGGSCDCGGWDVGCKLHILTNQDQISKNLRPLSSSAVEGLNLFVQGGHRDKKPIFSLSPFTGGVYSVDFDSSISLIEAFFIAVSFLSSEKLSNLFAVELEKENLAEPTNLMIKNPTTIQDEVPTSYVINPPSSPVGRV
ncbi:uncharacterized protein LOC141708118 [Apium graveolens]|uniref:uncharacterized protein LOC141708118 n=1 Tax=Apium graveolens TaxID=4045 RepID=UPI003D7AAEF1